MEIYHYHPLTGEYVGSSPANPDPLEPGRFVIPAHATDVAPAAVSAGETAVWGDGAWRVVPDHRGQTVYRKVDGTPVSIDWLGEIPAEFTGQPPPPRAVWDEAVGAWRVPPPTAEELLARLEQAKQVYLDKHYPLPTILWLSGYNGNPKNPQDVKNAIEPAWTWIDAVVDHMLYTVGPQIKASGAWVEPEFEKNFDAPTGLIAQDPGISVPMIKALHRQFQTP